MIIFGTRASNLGAYLLNSGKCSHCGQTEYAVVCFARYLHVFWIPIFPIVKKYYAECTHCKKTYEYRQFSDDMKQAVNELEFKTPIWHFAGLMIFGGFFALSLISSLLR